MKNIIGIIALNDKFKEDVEGLYPVECREGRIIIEVVDKDGFVEQGKMLQKKGADVLVCAGGILRYLEPVLDIPVLAVRFRTVDILDAVKRASLLNREIVSIFRDRMFSDYEKWKDMITIHVTPEYTDEYDEIRENVEKYVNKKDEVVFIGGGITHSVCEELGFDSIYINAGKESIRESIADAMYFIENLRDEKFRSEVLSRTLDSVNDAVIGIDNDSRIIIFNERAEKLLQRNEEEVKGKHILGVFPLLDFVESAKRNEGILKRNIHKIGNIVVTLKAVPMKIDGEVTGTLFTFQDITKLQKLEKNIRFEVNKKGLVAKHTFETFTTVDKTMVETVEKARRISKTDYTVLLYGESGTGKELFAQSIHNSSNRNDYPFVAVNCAALSENLLESELFGYVEGAFTGARKEGKSGLFEMAHGGTIFLDEINSISQNLQAKLLRVIEEKEIMRLGSDYVIPLDVRILAAANEELKLKVEDGSFRADLFYRINPFEISIPPLRDRKDDVIPLFNRFIEELGEKESSLTTHDDKGRKLMSYNWPGNVRELRNIAQRYVFFGDIEIDSGKERVFDNEGKVDGFGNIDLGKVNHHIEKLIIKMMLDGGMTKTEVAKKLGISRTSLWSKLKEERG
jgi:propionate catabolism operon transcriptional regulator